MKYVTTNLRLEDDLYRRLKHLAVERGQRAAHVIREAIRRYLEFAPVPEEKRSQEKDPFWRVVGIGKSRLRDGSTRHDAYLYGARKKGPA